MATTDTRTDTRTSDHDTRSPEPGSTLLRRRGLIAAAAALGVGMAARQAQPVSANTDGGALTIATGNTASRTTNLVALGTFNQVSGAFVAGFDAGPAPGSGQSIAGVVGYGGGDNGNGVMGGGKGVSFQNSLGDFADGSGVLGRASGGNSGVHGISPSGTGVYGASVGGSGVVGTSPGGTGVFGSSTSGGGSGVYGTNSTGGYGVYGFSGSGNGVLGYSNGDHAIFGTTFTTTAGKAGVFGLGNGTGTYGVRGDGSGTGIGVSGVSSSNIGVQGNSTIGIGVYGISGGGSSAGAQPFGVVGSVTSAPGFALYGVANVSGTVGFAAGAGVSGAIAGQFAGPVNIYNNGTVAPGNLYVQGNQTVSGSKSAAVPHPDGTHRLLYCVESPEAWFEDFGEGTITGGKAEVKLDPDFAAVVDTSKLHVFCMPHDETHHLAVKTRSGGGFSVAADVSSTAAARGVKATDVNGTFTYRVVAKRKDVKAERLAKFAVP